jgi:Ni/Fe-hydrogenase b-type cytochrome subunit
MGSTATADVGVTAPPDRRLVYRHRLVTRLTHWLNALAILCLLGSGLMIFNAHPMLYWGQYGANFDTPLLKIGAEGQRGYLRVGSLEVTTTGVLGLWKDSEGATQRRAFPGWATIPSNYSLADGRRWHFFFAWVLVANALLYTLFSLANGHLRRDLLPTRAELSPRHILHDIKEHARLRFPTGEAARHYNVLQKLAYLGVMFGALPLVILTGLTMSPALNAAWPWLLDLFGGRQSARTLHFVAAFLIALFIVVHLLMVLLAGPWNEIRSMVTGRYRLPEEKAR